MDARGVPAAQGRRERRLTRRPYPNWTLTPADAAFAGRPGCCASRPPPTRSPAAPSPPWTPAPAPRRTSSTPRSMTPAPRARRPAPLALDRPVHRAGQPGRHRLAAQGLRANQAAAAVHRRAGGSRGGRRQHRRVPGRAGVLVRGAGRAAALPRPGQRGPAAGDLLGHPHPGRADPPRPAARHRRPPGEGPAALGAPGRPGPVHRRGGRGRASARKVIIFAYDEGTEGRDRGGSTSRRPALPGYQDALSTPSPRPTRTPSWCSTPATRCSCHGRQVKSILECGTPAS